MSADKSNDVQMDDPNPYWLICSLLIPTRGNTSDDDDKTLLVVSHLKYALPVAPVALSTGALMAPDPALKVDTLNARGSMPATKSMQFAASLPQMRHVPVV